MRLPLALLLGCTGAVADPPASAPSSATPAAPTAPIAPAAEPPPEALVVRLCGQPTALTPAARVQQAAAPLDALRSTDGPVDLDLSALPTLDEDALAAALHSPAAQRLVGLDLGGRARGPGAGKAIGSSPHLSELERLSAAGAGLGQAGIRALAYGENLPGLKVLSLAGAGLDATALEALAGAQGFGGLVALNLQKAEVPAEQVAGALLGAPLPALRCLIVDDGVSAETLAAWEARGVAVQAGATLTAPKR